MNRTVKEATVRAFHYDDLECLKAHGLSFVTAYNFAKHLKALKWKTPFQSICDAWKSKPSAFKINPHHGRPPVPKDCSITIIPGGGTLTGPSAVCPTSVKPEPKDRCRGPTGQMLCQGFYLRAKFNPREIQTETPARAIASPGVHGIGPIRSPLSRSRKTLTAAPSHLCSPPG